MSEVPLCRVKDVPPGAVVCTRVAGIGRIAVTRVDHEYIAFNPVCPHANGPLAEGELRGSVIICPWHFFRFDLRTGKPPGATTVLEVGLYPVLRRGERLFVEAHEERAAD
jgi:3-phenylpropionate/trans-cinnamate dioxygenase ferredoxin component